MGIFHGLESKTENSCGIVTVFQTRIQRGNLCLGRSNFISEIFYKSSIWSFSKTSAFLMATSLKYFGQDPVCVKETGGAEKVLGEDKKVMEGIAWKRVKDTSGRLCVHKAKLV